MTDVLIPEWTFGDRLLKARRMAKLSVEAVAQMSDGLATERAIRSWESDERLPRKLLKIAQLYAKATGVSVEWILTGRELAQPRPKLTILHTGYVVPDQWAA